MTQFVYEIKDAAGIHARPSGLLVKLAATFQSDITIECNGKKVSAKKL
ncbi:MAG: HPr family phosphocarrier protein, partial [Oscillospiraceae bacterium]